MQNLYKRLGTRGCMASKEPVCNACKTRVTNLSGAVQFKCPKCAKEDIVRCPHCRKIGAPYVCAACEFTGP